MTTPRQYPPQRRPGTQGCGVLGLAIGAILLFGFWPAMVWHGYTGTGGWRWDIQSTVAELMYFGTIAFIALMVRAGNRPAKGGSDA